MPRVDQDVVTTPMCRRLATHAGENTSEPCVGFADQIVQSSMPDCVVVTAQAGSAIGCFSLVVMQVGVVAVS